MNFKFTKSVLLSSMLFTGAMSWNAYSMNYYDCDGHNVGVEAIRSHIEGIFDAIKLNHKNCDILIKETNREQLQQTLETIENDLEKVISDRKSVSPELKEKQEDLLETLSSNSYKTIENAQAKYLESNPKCTQDSNAQYHLYYGRAAGASIEDFMKNKYRMMETALTLSKHDELLEKIRSMPEDTLKAHFNNGFNTKQMLEHLFSLNHHDSSSLDDPNEVKRAYLLEEICHKEVFEAAIAEKIERLSSRTEDYRLNKLDEHFYCECALNDKVRKIYKDLNQIINYCSLATVIEEIFDGVKSSHRKSDILIKEINGEQLQQTLETIENDLEEVISRHETISPDLKRKHEDLLETLSSNSCTTIQNAQAEYDALNPGVKNDDSPYYRYYGEAMYALCQNFMKNKYLMMQTALTLSKHDELLEKIQSMPEDELKVHFNDGFNAKQMLEKLFSFNHDDSSLVDDPLVDETKRAYLLEEICSKKMFETLVTERLKLDARLSDRKYEESLCESFANKKVRALYKDLQYIIKYCYNEFNDAVTDSHTAENDS